MVTKPSEVVEEGSYGKILDAAFETFISRPAAFRALMSVPYCSTTIVGTVVTLAVGPRYVDIIGVRAYELLFNPT